MVESGPRITPGSARGVHHPLRQGRAFLLQRREADFIAQPFEAKFVARVGAIEHGESGGGDFGTDAVAGEYEDFHFKSLRISTAKNHCKTRAAGANRIVMVGAPVRVK